MWIFLNNAMLSIVAPAPDSVAATNDKLLVRGRLKGDIERIFPKAMVTETPGRDYRFRALLPRKDVAAAMVGEVERITYGNFKDSVGEKDRHDAYFGAWKAMHALQWDRIEAKRPAPRSRKGKAKRARPLHFPTLGYI